MTTAMRVRRRRAIARLFAAASLHGQAAAGFAVAAKCCRARDEVAS